MPGDVFSAKATSWYRTAGAVPATPVSPLNSLLSALVNGISTIAGGGKTMFTQLQQPGVLDPALNQMLTNQNASAITGIPKAGLYWVLLDNQLKYITGSFDFVGSNEQLKNNVLLNISIPQNGYLYIYTANQTPNIAVFFDNLQVVHQRSSLLEETHYYPFGLTMKGISDKALAFGGAANKKKFNAGTELNTDLDLNLYETNFRSLDPQLGRFWQVDPLAEFHYGISQYTYVLNNPLTYNDPLGLDTVKINGEGKHKIKIAKGDVLAWTIGDKTSYYTYDPGNKDAVQGFVGGGIQDNKSEEAVVTAKTKASKNSSILQTTGTASNTVNSIGGIYENFYSKTTLGLGFKQPWYKLKPYSSGFRGNQFIKAYNVSKLGKLAGAITFGLGTSIDAYGVYTYYTKGSENPNAVSPAKAASNLGVGMYGIFGGPPGWISGTIYFVGDAAIPGGWPAAMEAGSANIQNNKDILGSWNPRPGGGLGN